MALLLGMLSALFLGRVHVSERHRSAAWKKPARVTFTPSPQRHDGRLQRKVTRATESLLRRIARQVAASDADRVLKESLHDAAREVRRELDRRNLSGLSRALDALEETLSDSIDDLDDQLREIGREPRRRNR